MGIQNKLEEIRKRPEHIRLRYVWAMVAISMVFVIIIWFFSLKANRTQTASPMKGLDTSEITGQFNAGKQSLESATEGFQNALEQSQTPNNSVNNIQ